MSLINDLKKATKSGYTEVLTKSALFNEKTVTRTRIPALNIALSGSLDGGLTSGLTVFAGPSRHFKSNIGLLCVAAYLKQFPDAYCVFIDTEFGISPEYMRAMGVDPDRVLHVQCESVEVMKFEMATKLKKLRERQKERKKGEEQDRVIFFIDSIGNAASIKEITDAEDGKSVADMTRAKQLKSLFRIVTPFFTMLNIPCVAVNHTYETQEMYSKTVMSGGTGVMYSADTVIILGRQQEKDGKEIVGYNFIMNVEKSRYVREKSKIPLNVTYEGGVNTYSGLLDIALDASFVSKPSVGWFSRATTADIENGVFEYEEGKKRRAETETVEFWKPLFAMPQFHEAISSRFKVAAREFTADDDVSEDLFGA